MRAREILTWKKAEALKDKNLEWSSCGHGQIDQDRPFIASGPPNMINVFVLIRVLHGGYCDGAVGDGVTF